ncbi:MAG: hypothetical protein JETT_1193 [Candidatus Jettenia ecosi]|uniref:Uncharacterized protein n=1 Tax=Candidatus Jettenia ecosi TaxID=2494326 RepID=A0A533QCZ5_9BACT|nr:MAG: hypothetical protein JETT_1193 [Candidatus Jettenia ecosi]
MGSRGITSSLLCFALGFGLPAMTIKNNLLGQLSSQICAFARQKPRPTSPSIL